tara:strand:+ start:121 stop:909 length:789 start_codon:yes stop_codon:yes gene_type:complete
VIELDYYVNGIDLYSKTEFYTPFPDPKDVFADPVDLHLEFLIPVGTLSLSVFSEMNGFVHFVLPKESPGGCGENLTKHEDYFSFYCRKNYLGFNIKEGKYQLDTDFNFFLKRYYENHSSSLNVTETQLKALTEQYAYVEKEVQERKTFYQNNQWLCSDIDKYNKEKYQFLKRPFVQSIGGRSFHGNWSNFTYRFPLSRYPDRFIEGNESFECDQVLPQTKDGRDFVFIGSLEMWNYIGSHNGILMLFYDPVDKIALNTIDWT